MFPVLLTALYSRGCGAGSGGHLFVPAGPRPWWSLPSRVPGSCNYWLLYLRGWVWMRLCAATAASTHCRGRGKPGEGPCLEPRATGLRLPFLLPRVEFGGEQEPKNCKTDTQPPGCACAPAGKAAPARPPRADLPQAGCEGTCGLAGPDCLPPAPSLPAPALGLSSPA